MTATNTYRRILVSPLNWGLGHATRLIPIVDALVKKGHYVLLAGQLPSLDVLRQTFPELDWVELNGFNVQLSASRHQWLRLMKQIPFFFSSIKQEHKLTQSIIKQYNIDLIISDNRYGVWSKEVHSVIITHQTTPSAGKHLSFVKPLSNLVSRHWLRKFDECWVPDIASQDNLSGTLSGTISQLNTHHIGLPSRLSLVDSTTDDTCEVLIIISGPEPQRSILEHTLISRFKDSHYQTTLLSGTPGGFIRKKGSVKILPHCNAKLLKSLIINSRYIICRSGYSTLIDLIHCQQTALLVPTPGQYEQEYLAIRASELWDFRYINQQQLEEVALECLLREQKAPLPFNGSTELKLPMWL
ncbi:hypothetical protein KDU71_02195 [Carboxylicivirga sediminis]|uniref:Glycosyltransferase n=1 Tax=Carboxylicivirga sediminis TaxID=2006564 RepID=A0A941F0R1_9BACT|nr:hypothetical protein [Carboxylicivirga sediminis]MBR8534354.1 hypothetical protein [Carboxylicivirga sediminis]